MNSSEVGRENPVLSMQESSLAVSVVMPAYNEADNIAGAFEDVVSHVFCVVPNAEMVFVDDGSRDNTFQIAMHHAQLNPRIRVMSQQNAGHGPALLHGIAHARGEYCLLLDSDRQIGLQGFAQTWRLVQTQDAVLGVRSQRDDPRHRLVLSAVLRFGLSRVLGVRSADANAPYKLVRRQVVLRAIELMPKQARIPSILLTTYLWKRRFKIVEQAVPHAARRAGTTTLNLKRLIVFCSKALIEFLHFYRTLCRSNR